MLFYLPVEVARGVYFHGRDISFAAKYFFQNVLTLGFLSVQ